MLECCDRVAPCKDALRAVLRGLRGQRDEHQGAERDQRQASGMNAEHKLYDTAIAGSSASHYAGSRLAMILRTGIRPSLGIAAGALLLWPAAAQQQQSKPGDLGF